MTDCMSYIGRKACGCVVAATVDDPKYRKEVAKDIAGFIRDGLTVERVTVEEVRSSFRVCACNKALTQQGTLL